MSTEPATQFPGFGFLLLAQGQPVAGFMEVSGLGPQDGSRDCGRRLTLKRGLVQASFLAGWQEGQHTTSTGGHRTLTLQLLDERSQAVACAWKLTQVRLVSSSTSMKSGATGLLAVEELMLAFQAMELEQGF